MSHESLTSNSFPPTPERLSDIPSAQEILMANQGASVEDLKQQVAHTNAAREHAIEGGANEADLREDAIKANKPRVYVAPSVGGVALKTPSFHRYG